MKTIQTLLTDHIDIWTAADTEKKSGRGRCSGNANRVYGIKKLRELILELAVRGKLVPQEPNDEPASVLLKRIQTEKAKLIAEGKIKKDKSLPSITEDEKPFDLPNGWAYSNLGDVVEIVRGITFPGTEKSKDPADGRIACLRTTNVQDQIEWDDILYIREKFVSREDQLLKPCDIVMSMANSRELVGKVALVDEKVNQKTTFGGFLGVLRPFFIDPRFVMALLRTPHAREMLIDSASQTTNIANVSLAKLRPLFFAIPPLAEQHRIVAKVDELMALCDQLEQQQTHSIEAHQALVETLLGTLTRVESQQEFSAAWARIASHFDTLFTTEASIDQLKQTILQLAVMGKLVPQDSNDESASVLLQRIATEKARLINEGRISKPKPLPPVTEEEKQFDIPDGWMWTRFDDLALHSEAGWSPSCEPIPRQGDNWGVLKVSAVTWGKYDPHENKALPANLEPKPELEVMPGDFLISRANTAELVARAVVVPNGAPPRLMMSDKIIRFVFTHELDHKYLTLVNRSELSRAYYARVAGGTSSSMKNVSREQIRNLVVALPPLAEQHRIVAKVDELMALCDALKARLADAQTTQLHLADAIVEQAVC